MTIDEITTKLKGVKRSQDGFVAKCPGHDDDKGSLTVRASGGKVLLHCFAGCSAAAVVGALGIELKDLFDDRPHPASLLKPRSFNKDGVGYYSAPKAKIVEVYPYTDVNGRLLYENVRFEPKDFRQVKADGNRDLEPRGCSACSIPAAGVG